jgi:hypothetical protein
MLTFSNNPRGRRRARWPLIALHLPKSIRAGANLLIQINAATDWLGHFRVAIPLGMGLATMRIDLLELADELAEIARRTTDEITGERLMKVVERLLTENGLPSDDNGGGELPPGRLLSEPVCEPA